MPNPFPFLTLSALRQLHGYTRADLEKVRNIRRTLEQRLASFDPHKELKEEVREQKLFQMRFDAIRENPNPAKVEGGGSQAQMKAGPRGKR